MVFAKTNAGLGLEIVRENFISSIDFTYKYKLFVSSR